MRWDGRIKVKVYLFPPRSAILVSGIASMLPALWPQTPPPNAPRMGDAVSPARGPLVPRARFRRCGYHPSLRRPDSCRLILSPLPPYSLPRRASEVPMRGVVFGDYLMCGGNKVLFNKWCIVLISFTPNVKPPPQRR